MKKGGNIIEFGKILNQKGKDLIDVQTHWVVTKSIDWDAKTMISTGVVDDLDFYDTVLGIGSIYKKPVVGSKCLIGIINNDPAVTFLIECTQIESFELIDKTAFKVSLNNGLMTINGDVLGGIVKAKELKTQVDKNTLILEKIQQVFANWVPVPNDGGASLKALVSSFVSLQRANLQNIENNKIKHG